MKPHRPSILVRAGGVAAGVVAAFAGFASVAADTPPTFTGPAVTTITADLFDGAGKQIGNVQASQDASGVVQLRVNATGLSAGDHGIHIHATGKCDGAAFATANGHFNPASKQHGLLNPAGHHAGDLPSLTAAANGTAAFTTTTRDVSLLSGGSNSIFDADGSALVIHAAADDQLTDPSGNSGARIACAVLAAPNPALAAATPAAPATGSGAGETESLPMGVALGGLLVLVAGGAVALQLRRR